MWRAYRNLFNTTQREDEDLKSFYDRFQGVVEVLENYGADIGGLSDMYKKEIVINDTEFENLSAAEIVNENNIKIAKNKAKEKFLGYRILASCDKKRYGNLVEDLENAYTFGDNKYPETQHKSYDYAMNYKHYKPKMSNNNNNGGR